MSDGPPRADGTPRARSPRATALRIFLTLWLVYGLHFATDIVREHYPALALADHFSFRLDEYAGLHPDLFETEEKGWRQGNNPGVSFFAAIPYALAKPAIDPIVENVRERRARTDAEPPDYDTPWQRDREFFRKTWRRGIDVKLGLASWVMQFFFMAPLCALSGVLVFAALRWTLESDRLAVWLALLYGLGTPIFYRAAFLNHNMTLGIIAFAGFLMMWDPWERWELTTRGRFLVGGLAGGLAVLFDYSGVIFLAGLFVYGLFLGLDDQRSSPDRPARAWDAIRRRLPPALGWFGLGALGPIGLLWFYQWQSFGNPFLPGQHWMPPVQWIEEGYQGYGLPQLDLFLMLGFDYRFGLFVFCPLLVLALAAPLVARWGRRLLPARETWFILALFLALWIFFSGSNYTRLQYNTGVRYMTPIIPFLFLPAAAVLARFRARPAYLVGAFSVGLMWCLAMYREVQKPLGVLDPVLKTLAGGFQLPALRTFERMGDAYGGFAAGGASPLPIFVFTGAILYAVWRVGKRERLR